MIRKENEEKVRVNGSNNKTVNQPLPLAKSTVSRSKEKSEPAAATVGSVQKNVT